MNTRSMNADPIYADPVAIRRSQDNSIFRSTQMSLMNEALARAHCYELREHAEHERRALRVLAARRMERRAARAAQRARRLAAAALASSGRSY